MKTDFRIVIGLISLLVLDGISELSANPNDSIHRKECFIYYDSCIHMMTYKIKNDSSACFVLTDYEDEFRGDSIIMGGFSHTYSNSGFYHQIYPDARPLNPYERSYGFIDRITYFIKLSDYTFFIRVFDETYSEFMNKEGIEMIEGNVVSFEQFENTHSILIPATFQEGCP